MSKFIHTTVIIQIATMNKGSKSGTDWSAMGLPAPADEEDEMIVETQEEPFRFKLDRLVSYYSSIHHEDVTTIILDTDMGYDIKMSIEELDKIVDDN